MQVKKKLGKIGMTYIFSYYFVKHQIILIFSVVLIKNEVSQSILKNGVARIDENAQVDEKPWYLNWQWRPPMLSISSS